MDAGLVKDLVKHLNQLVLIYRHLFDTVRREKQVLLKADLGALEEINKSKEAMLYKINEVDKKWMAVAADLCQRAGLDASSPRLSDIADLCQGDTREKLMRFRTTLNLLVQRTSMINKQNDFLAQSALSHISGAMKSITDTLNKNSTYEKKGKRSEAPLETSGRLVSSKV